MFFENISIRRCHLFIGVFFFILYWNSVASEDKLQWHRQQFKPMGSMDLSQRLPRRNIHIQQPPDPIKLRPRNVLSLRYSHGRAAKIKPRWFGCKNNWWNCLGKLKIFIPTFRSSSSMTILGSPTLLVPVRFSPASRIFFYSSISILWVPPTAGRGLDHCRRLAPPKVYWSSAKAATWLSHRGGVRPSPHLSLSDYLHNAGNWKQKRKHKSLNANRAPLDWTGKACFAFDHLLSAYVTLTVTRNILRSWQLSLRGK